MVTNELIANAFAKYLGFPKPRDESGPLRAEGYGLSIEKRQLVLTGQLQTDPPIPYGPGMQCYYELGLTVEVSNQISSVLTYKTIGNREGICSSGLSHLPSPETEKILVALVTSLRLMREEAQLPDQVLTDLNIDADGFQRSVTQLIYDSVKDLPAKH